MLKVISKNDCPRCEQIKNYLTERNIPFEVEMAEDKGYGYWREFIMNTTGVAGFPLLEKFNEHDPNWKGETLQPIYEYVNGSSEQIIEKICEWFPTPVVGVDVAIPESKPTYFWGE